ncbi:MAG: hypothetical protein HY741_20535 [Chloroflexi bacterium]|nr:hypothetical protein [Chloroflexota bacterium]
MNQPNRGRIIFALMLILFGVYLLALQFFPALRIYQLNESNWPLLIVAAGALVLVGALLTWSPNLMVPAAVIGGIGGILYWQNTTNNWASWAYVWTLIPAFVGVGIFLMHLMQGNLRQAIVAGGAPILVGLAAFLIFASFFGAIGMFGQYWPLLLVLLGVILLAQVFWRRK